MLTGADVPEVGISAGPPRAVCGTLSRYLTSPSPHVIHDQDRKHFSPRLARRVGADRTLRLLAGQRRCLAYSRHSTNTHPFACQPHFVKDGGQVVEWGQFLRYLRGSRIGVREGICHSLDTVPTGPGVRKSFSFQAKMRGRSRHQVQP